MIRVLKIGEESFLRRIAKYVEEARAMKPGIIQLVDRILKIYVPGVIVIAGIGFLIWTFGSYFATGKMNIIRAAFASISVFIMGYPCALGMATPLALIRDKKCKELQGISWRRG